MSKKILVISDLHQNRKALSLLDDYLSQQEIDLLLCSGDLTDRNYDSLDYAQRFLEIIKRHKQNFFYLHGNNEPREVVDFFNKEDYSIHLKYKNCLGENFIGIGGFMEEWDPALSEKLGGAILVTHYPPRKRELKFKNAPKLHISGHRHRTEKIEKMGDTIFVSVPALSDTERGALISIPELKISFVNL